MVVASLLSASRATAAPPACLFFTPIAATNSAGQTLVTVQGGSLAEATGLGLARDGETQIHATGFTTSSSQATGTFDLTGRTPGMWTLSILGPQPAFPAEGASCGVPFNVIGLPPTVDSTDPGVLGQGALNVPATFKGTAFTRTTTVSSPNSGVTILPPTFVDTTTLRALVSIDSTAVMGSVVIVASNADGSSGMCATCLSISTGPTVDSVSASSPQPGGTGEALTISGRNFHSGAAPSISISGHGITVRNIQRTDSHTITALVDVAKDAATGVRDVSVTNSDDFGTASCAGCLTISGQNGG